VALATRAIHLKYQSAERFHKDYNQLRKGHLFLPANKVLPTKTILTLHITVAGIDRIFVAKGVVISTMDLQTAEKLKKAPGMLVAILGGPDSIIKNLDTALSSNVGYRNMLGLAEPKIRSEPAHSAGAVSERSPPAKTTPRDTAADTQKTADSDPRKTPTAQVQVTKKPAAQRIATDDTAALDSMDDDRLPDEMPADPEDADLSIEWLKQAVAQQEAIREKEAEPEIIAPPFSEKKVLSYAEREKIKPVVELIIDLTKAMLRSEHYAADHPGAKEAKRGLYDAFQERLGDASEMVITIQETREQTDILITGILDDPVNVRTLVGETMAELFFPKLREYFNRKGLVSLAIKKRITADHFESFVDIMSDPKADRGKNSKIGELLTNALIAHGITAISTVFMDDMIALKRNLPWRVEMAIQHLAKDLKVLPMFKTASDDAIRAMKLMIIQDNSRLLRHPEFLKDFIVNCSTIAKHVESVDTEEIEKVIIEAFPMDTLLPTSRYIFDELHLLREQHADTPEKSALHLRLAGVKRILKWVSRRLVLSDVRGAQSFLEQLYLNEVLTFEELPPDVQYLVNTLKMANDVQAHFSSYVYRILKVDSAENAVVLLKCFRRMMPVIMEQKQWDIALTITEAVCKAAKENEVFSRDSGLPLKPQKFIYKDLTTDLYEAYTTEIESQRQVVGRIVGKLGSQGIEILGRVLSDCDDRGARRDATDFLIKKGDMARRWVLKILDDPKQPWYLQRNALMILRYVGKEEADIDRARKLIANDHPRIRDEALNTVVALKADDAEQLVVAALNDPDDKIRWRATSALSELAPLTDASVEIILDIIQEELPAEKEEADKHIRKASQLITSLGFLEGLRNPVPVENTLLDIARKASEHKKGILLRLTKYSDTDPIPILTAVVATLGKIGTPRSEAFLTRLAAGKTPLAEAARKAVESIRHRYAKQQANFSSGA
jgi:HEAT repeat protein